MGSFKTDRGNSGIVSDGEDDLRALRWVGSHTADRLRSAEISPIDLTERRVSYADLREAQVNPGIAALLRREYSLPWSHASDGGDLDRRAEQVRGLGADERAWVSVSAGEWEDTPVQHATDRVLDRERTAEWDDPTPPSTIRGIGPQRAEALAEAGVISVRALCDADPDALAAVLDVSADTIRTWQTRGGDQQ